MPVGGEKKDNHAESKTDVYINYIVYLTDLISDPINNVFDLVTRKKKRTPWIYVLNKLHL